MMNTEYIELKSENKWLSLIIVTHLTCTTQYRKGNDSKNNNGFEYNEKEKSRYISNRRAVLNNNNEWIIVYQLSGPSLHFVMFLYVQYLLVPKDQPNKIKY